MGGDCLNFGFLTLLQRYFSLGRWLRISWTQSLLIRSPLLKRTQMTLCGRFSIGRRSKLSMEEPSRIELVFTLLKSPLLLSMMVASFQNRNINKCLIAASCKEILYGQSLGSQKSQLKFKALREKVTKKAKIVVKKKKQLKIY